MQSCVGAHVHVKAGMLTCQGMEMHDRMNVHFQCIITSATASQSVVPKMEMSSANQAVQVSPTSEASVLQTILTPLELLPEHPQLLLLCMQCHAVTNKLPRSCCTYSSHQNIKIQLLLYQHLHICRMLSQGFGLSGMEKDELLHFFPEHFFLQTSAIGLQTGRIMPDRN